VKAAPDLYEYFNDTESLQAEKAAEYSLIIFQGISIIHSFFQILGSLFMED
jgi:hypothetical protein